MKRRLPAGLFTLLIPLLGFAQTIPASRIYDWNKSGYSGIRPVPSLSVNVMDFGAVADGITDDHAAISAAIASLGGRLGIVYLPPGRYRVESSIILPDSVIFKGAGSQKSILEFDLSGVAANCIEMAAWPAGTFTGVDSGWGKGSAMILTSSISGISTGDIIELRQRNGGWDTNPASWADYSVGHLTRAAAVTGNYISMEDPLRIDFDTALGPQVRRFDPLAESSVECLAIQRADSPAGGGAYNIFIAYAYNCRVTGVESYRSHGSHVMMESCLHAEVTGCYFHESWIYDGASTRGYGVTLRSHAVLSKVEDNIFRKLRHAMMVKEGANGNVFAYNYSMDPYRSELPNNGGADLSVHGHYAFANLFEGNDGNTLMVDHTWGPGGPHNTFFRNRLGLYGIIMTPHSAETDFQSIVGNEITNGGILMGNYILTGTGHFARGNNLLGTPEPPGTSFLPDTSLYLDILPAFWQGQDWPSIGYPNTLDEGKVPAELRYAGGVLTSCTGETTPAGKIEGIDGVSAAPNPFSQELSIFSMEGELRVHDVTGRELPAEDYSVTCGGGAAKLIFSEKVPPGLLIICSGKNAEARLRVIRLPQ